jgi:hypothetical protein
VLGFLRRDAAWLGLIPAAVYTASWTGWFATPYGWNRNGAYFNNGHPTSTIAAWLAYNKWMLQFGLGLTTTQTYKSDPAGWLVLARPISFYSVCARPCGNATEQEVLAIGTPMIWWGSMAALLVCVALWLFRRDWRAAAVLASVAAGWLPWIWFYLHDHRTEFYYYAIAFEPFLIIGPQRASPGRRAVAPSRQAPTRWPSCSTSPTFTPSSPRSSSPTAPGCHACDSAPGSEPA